MSKFANGYVLEIRRTLIINEYKRAEEVPETIMLRSSKEPELTKTWQDRYWTSYSHILPIL